MSSISQTPGPASSLPRFGFGPRFALSMVAVAGLVGLSMRGALDPVVRMAATARPHLPDVALFASQSPAVKIHLLAALAALGLGAVLMLARKGRVFHRVAGWVWVVLVAATAGASIFITELNNGHWSLLHLITGWVLLVTPMAVIWARRHDVARHQRTMMGLFYGGFAINVFVAFIPGRLLWNLILG